jgi:hypothetical protein
MLFRLTFCFDGVRVAHRIGVLCCVFSFVCNRPVCCAPNVASVSELSPDRDPEVEYDIPYLGTASG